MTLIKVTTPGAYDFPEPQVQLVKVSSRGLLGEDRRNFEKRAASPLLQNFDKYLGPPDEPLVHLIAIGATELVGPNRNGDAFSEATCRKYHPTFVKFARLYRSHLNRDVRKSYGIVKASAYNEPMRRIELLVALNASPAAAKRNGGLVADKEMQKLASGQPIGVSMACRVPFDVCSYCGNRARNRQEYCQSPEEGGHCKAGGLRKHIGELVEVDGTLHHLHADNPDPTWFDISHVYRPADRIAYVLGELEKSAADGKTISGAELAEEMGLTLPPILLVSEVKTAAERRAVGELADLAAIEQTITLSPVKGFLPSFHPDVQTIDYPPPQGYREKFAQFMRALTDRRVMLPLPHFLHLTTDLPLEKAAETAVMVRRYLPGIFTDFLSRTDIADIVSGMPYWPADRAPEAFRFWAEKHAEAFSLREADVRRRAQLGVICGDTPVTIQLQSGEKTAVVCAPAKALAEQYALYQLSFLGAIPSSSEKPLIQQLAVLHNYVQ